MSVKVETRAFQTQVRKVARAPTEGTDKPESPSMLKKYMEWADKARDAAFIGDRVLLLLGDSAEILKDTALAADAAIMDPPYKFDAEGGPKLFNRRPKSKFHDMRERGLADGFDPAILEYAALAPSMAVFFHNDQLPEISAFLDENYDRFALCGWRKENPLPVANKHYVPDSELYIHAWRAPAFPQGEMSEKSRIVIDKVGKSAVDHPTVKPQKIMRKVVTNASRPGDVVLDPFSGSGSTGVAAVALGRFYIGIEKDPDFYEISKERLAGITGEWLPSDERKQPTLF